MTRSIVERLLCTNKTGNLSLEESLYESYRKIDRLPPIKQKKYQEGDIILTSYYSPKSKKVVEGGHRIIVITSKENNPAYGGYRYEGLAMSSNVQKSNKNGGYPDSIYVDNYDSILSWRDITDTKPVMVICSELAKATSFDTIIGKNGTVKIGEVKPEFLEFIKKAYKDKGTGKNKYRYWIGGKAVNGDET